VRGERRPIIGPSLFHPRRAAMPPEATMTTPMHRPSASRIAAAAVAAFLGLAAAANAQTTGSQGNGSTADAVNISRAEALEAQAAALFSTFPFQFPRIARLFEKAAHLRAEDDPLRVHDLLFAGKMYHHGRRLGESRHNLTLAAETAMRYGELVTAAHAFLDAAFVALEQKDVETANRLAKRAECLSRSPLIAAGDVSSIRRRLGAAEGPMYVVR
jgi:hypothetical protein